MDERFQRTEMLLGEEALRRLASAHVIVFGVGGVGGACAEALCRAGVGAIELVDDDVVGITNVNRQIVALTSTLGQAKAEAMAERLHDINPACDVVARRCFYLPETAGDFDLGAFDYVVDCVDTVTAKLQLVAAAKAARTPIISCMGTANKLDPTAFRVADIDSTSVCPLARIMRKEARRRGLGHFKVVYSTEPARTPTQPADLASELRAGSSARSLPGSVSFVPPVAGYVLASAVVRDLTGI